MMGTLPREDEREYRHVWRQTFAPRSDTPRPALFLDRDGVIVESVPYLHRVGDVRLIPGAAETISRANRQGVLAALVTNQAGIGRGLYGWEQFHDVQRAVLQGLRDCGALLDGVFACPHHPEADGIYAHPSHPARKPSPGMLLLAAEDLNITLSQSWIIGDRASDLEAGRAAGIAGGLLVLTGLGEANRDAAAALRTPAFQVLIAPSIEQAAAMIPLLA